MRPLPLTQYAARCEDAASGLVRFSDSLPGSESSVAIAVSELFGISAILRHICEERSSGRYASSLGPAYDDSDVACQSLGLTLDDIFELFVKVEHRPEYIIWEELNHRLALEGPYPLTVRLRLYHDFFDVQANVRERQRPANTERLRQSVCLLLDAQERARSPCPSAVPRPRRTSGPPTYDYDAYSDRWDTEYLHRPRGPAPEPPSPLSPTYTSGSSQTFGSSQTSYSSGMFFSPPPVLPHWSLRVFDGQHPTTVYSPAFRSNDRSACFGDSEPGALQNLARDVFQSALQVTFDEGNLTAGFYWRPSDNRARILIAAKNASGSFTYFCLPLNNLKIIREKFILQLCRARREDGQYTLWARLNFYFHERMVLFYSTYTAMKRQDTTAIIPRQLADGFELETQNGEQCLFSGQIKHDGMLHAVRVFRDRGSGVVRLEAAALRGKCIIILCSHHMLRVLSLLGSKKDVVLWTAFVTRYTNNPHWPALERGVVSLAAFQPPPYVFLSHYEPPRDGKGQYVLPFTTDNGTFSFGSLERVLTTTLDGVMFLQTWTQICGSYG